MPDPPSPTPGEIAAATAAIRATWTEAERIARFVGSHRGGGRSSSGVDGPGIKEFASTGDGRFTTTG